MRTRDKFPPEIEAYCMKLSNELYLAGYKPLRIIKTLEAKGIKGVNQGDIALWRKMAGIEPKYRFYYGRAEKTKKAPEAKKEAPRTNSDEAFVMLPKENLQKILDLCKEIISQTEAALEYERKTDFE